MRELSITPTALADIQDGIDFYNNNRQTGLGDRFEALVAAYIDAIAELPQAGTFYKDAVRYRVVRQFPYIILYRFDEAAVAVLRVFNTYLNPEQIVI